MVMAESDPEQCPITEKLALLEGVYSCVQYGSCPGLDPAHTACLLRSCLGSHSPAHTAGASALELSCVSVTVMDTLLSTLMSRCATPQFRLFVEETLTLIYQTDVMHQLLRQFEAEEQLVAHLSAKCVAASVLYELHQTSLVSGLWRQKCVDAFHSSPNCICLNSCVWSVTEVLIQLLKGAHQAELTEKVVSAFDSSLVAFCSKFFSIHREADSESNQLGICACLLLDLLEVLCVSRLMCREGTALSSPCLICTHTSDLLAGACCPLLQPFTKRRMLLLLKRVLLCKVGEDWALVQPRTVCSDTELLAQSMLQAVAEGWLKRVHVEGTSFFGGTSKEPVAVGPNVDNVMLRAVCLILLKSMELQCQLSNAPEPVAVEACLQSLWDVLKRCSAQLEVSPHCCCWLSSVFGEQDDDMMEAAKALLVIFLYHRQQSSDLRTVSLLNWACSSGCNPHCHFLLLLQSLAFDHSVLLDFLISTETCFLEYFVRYLKYLRTDCEGFTAACTRFCPDLSESTTVQLLSGGAGRSSSVQLVEYSSSGESETEGMETIGDSLKELDQSAHMEFTDSKEIPKSGLNSAIHCLSQLRQVVSRLHLKKLFPYNPNSLLKLLTEVETKILSVSIK